MTIATVEQERRTLTIELGWEGEPPQSRRVLWAVQRKDRRKEVLLGSSRLPIAPGIRGVEQCIRFVVDHYWRPEKCQIEFDLDEMRNRRERHRLLSMAGGLLAAARMSRQRRQERAMKAATAKYADPEPYEKTACDGAVIRCWTDHVGSRQWVVTITIDDKEVWRKPCTSRREGRYGFDLAKMIVDFKEFLLKEQGLGNQ